MKTGRRIILLITLMLALMLFGGSSLLAAEASNEAQLQKAITEGNDDTITIMNNIALTKRLIINRPVTLTGVDCSINTGVNCIYVDSNGNLTLSGKLSITGNGEGLPTLDVSEGNANIIAGVIEATGAFGNGIYSSGNLNISGGEIRATGKESIALVLSGSVNMTGGTIKAEGPKSIGVGVSRGQFTISGGNITATGPGISVYTGTVNINSSENMNLSGGVYSEDLSTDQIQYTAFFTTLPKPVIINDNHANTLKLLGIDPSLSFTVGNSTSKILGASISGNTVSLNPTRIGDYILILSSNIAKQQSINLTIPVKVNNVSSSNSTSPQPNSNIPSDLSGHWAKDSIMQLINAGVIKGYPDGTCQPDKAISRAEFAVMLVKALKLEPKAGNTFSDTASHWAKDSIATVAAHGLVSGHNKNLFGPDEFTTREQAASVYSRLAKLESSTFDLNCTDKKSISAWAEPGVAAAVKIGFFNLYPDGSFKPQGYTTRAEAFFALYKYLSPEGPQTVKQ